MYMQLSELKDGKWKDKPEFAKYLKALKGIPEMGKSCADADADFLISYQPSSSRILGAILKMMS